MLADVEDLRHARRVLVYGVTGSGKSTASALLGDLLDLPVTLVDEEIGWLPAAEAGPWVARDDDDMRRIAGEIVTAERWVLDSAYGSFVDIVLDRADVIVGLDYPQWLTLVRLVRRCLARIIDRQLICNGNRETWANVFSRDSIVAWNFRSYGRKRSRMRAWVEEPERRIVLLRTPADLRRLVAEIQPATAPRS